MSEQAHETKDRCKRQIYNAGKELKDRVGRGGLGIIKRIASQSAYVRIPAFAKLSLEISQMFSRKTFFSFKQKHNEPILETLHDDNTLDLSRLFFPSCFRLSFQCSTS